jgi:hypothetical protein
MIRTLTLVAVATALSSCGGGRAQPAAITGPAAEERPAPMQEAEEEPAPNQAALKKVEATKYEVSGPRQLRGTLEKKDGGPWVLDVRLSFRTGGYTVGEPIVRMTRSIPPHVTITIPVTTPKPDDMVTQGLTGGSARVEIPAQDDAYFKVFVEEKERE